MLSILSKSLKFIPFLFVWLCFFIFGRNIHYKWSFAAGLHFLVRLAHEGVFGDGRGIVIALLVRVKLIVQVGVIRAISLIRTAFTIFLQIIKFNYWTGWRWLEALLIEIIIINVIYSYTNVLKVLSLPHVNLTIVIILGSLFSALSSSI